MGKSYGFFEVTGVSAAIDALDIMCKTASVEFVAWERKLGGRLVTIIIQGSVSDVTQAIDAACRRCLKKPAAHTVIANPHEETVRMVTLCASRLASAKADAAEENQDWLTSV